MVAIVSGSSLGLNLSSLASLGGHGQIGTATQGRNGEGAFINISSGNLVLQDMDGLLMGVGANVASLRTYNSQGLANFTNDDGWRIGQYKSVVAVGGNVLQRTDGDGSTASYAWDAASQSYLATVGAGSVVNSIKANSDGSYTWTNGATGATEHYAGSGSGLIQSSADTSGNTLAFQYDSSGLLTKVTDADGESVNYTYSGHNLVGLSTTLQSGQTLSEVTYSYDAQDRLTSVSVNLAPSGSLPSGSETLSSYVTNYTYDGTSDRIAGITQSDGTSLSFTYVQAGGSYRVASASDGLGNTTSFSYDTNANTTTVTDPLGTSSVYSYDSKGQLTQVRDGVTAANSGGLSQLSYAYNGLGDVTVLTDGSGHAVQMQYDARGNLTSQVDAAGDTHTWTYNAANQVQTSTVYTTPVTGSGANAVAAGGLETTRYVYASSNATQLRFVVTPEGDVTEYRYNASGLRTSVLSYSGGTYDSGSLGPTGLPTEAQMQTWAATQDLTRSQRINMVYDFRGQLQSSTTYATVDASGAGMAASATTTQYVYDQRGELVQSIQPNTASVAHYTYDGLGRAVSVSAPSLDGTTANLSLTSYDDANGKTTLTLANGLSTVSTYDRTGRLVSVVQSGTSSALGTTSYWYDTDGHLLMTQDPTGVHHWMMYDAEGRKVADIGPLGAMTEYVYNANGQVKKTIAYGNPVDVSQLIDSNGRPLTSWGTPVTLLAIRPTVTAQDQTRWSFYDAANRLSWTVDGSGAATQTKYDGESRIASTTQFAGRIDTTLLDAPSGVPVPQFPSGVNPVQLSASFSQNVASGSLSISGSVSDPVHALTGTVSIYEGTSLLGTTSLSTNFAFLTLTSLGIGTHNLTLVYSGDDWNASATTSIQVDVTRGLSAIELQGVPPAGSNLNVGAPLILTAQIAIGVPYPDHKAPTGTVTFRNGSALLGTAQVNNGIAQFDATGLLALGSANITASYSGDSNYADSVQVLSAGGAFNVIAIPPAATWVDLDITDVTTAVAGEPTTITANVLVSGSNAPVNGGTVTFYSDATGTNTAIGTANVVNGHASINTVVLLGENAYAGITAAYSGDSLDAASTTSESSFITFAPATTLSLSASSSTAAQGSDVTFTAQVLDARTDGQVTFFNGTQILGVATVSGGQANLTVNTLPPGSAVITASYSSRYSQTYNYSFSIADEQGVTVQILAGTPASTPSVPVGSNAIGLTLDGGGQFSNSLLFENATNVDAQHPLSGTYAFFEGQVLLGTTAAGRYPFFSMPWLSLGSHTITVVYSGDAYNASATATTTLNVQQGNAVISLHGNPPVNSTINSGAPLTLTASIIGGSIVFPAGMAPSGAVTFYNNGTAIGTAPVVNGLATLNATGLLSDGTAQITASYSGDSNYTSSTYVVNQPAVSFNVATGSTPSATWSELNLTGISFPPIGHSFPLTLTVRDIGTNALVTAGTVSFYKTVKGIETLIGTSSVVDGQATIDASISWPDTFLTFSAVYSGDANNLTSQASTAVNAIVPGKTITVSSSAAVLSQGAPGALTAHVTDGYADADSVGQVTFYNGASILGVSRVVNGYATLDTTGLPTGLMHVTASYAQDLSEYQDPTTSNGIDLSIVGSNGASPEQVAALVSKDNADDRTVTELYDRDSRLQATIDGEGYLTQYRYDSAGQLVETIGYSNPVPGFTDAQSIASAVATARTSHDLSALLPASTTTDIHSYRFYNARGQAVGQVDGDGYLTETVYDANGNVAQSIRYATPATGVTSTSTLAQIRPASTPQDQVVTQTWNAANELASRTGVDGTVTTFAYDSVGHLLQTTTALGTADQRTLTARYDVQGRVVAELSADGSALLTGNQTPAQIDAIWAQYATTYTYDAAGRRTSTTDAVGDRTVFFYDDAGRLRYTANALGEVTENTYDALGHLGSITRYATPLSGTALTALQGGLLSSSANLAAAAALNAAKAASTQNSTTQYAYDADGQEVLVTDALGGTTALSYDAFGDLAQSTRTFTGTQSVTSTSSYDRRGLQTGAVADVGTSTVNATTQAQYDAFGRLIQSVDANGNITSAIYDALGRTLSTTDGAGATRTTTYDAFGRTLTQTDALGATTTYSYDTAARSVTLTTAEGVVLTTVNTRTGQTQSVTDGDGNTTSYHYDADGNLLSTATPLTTTSNQYDAADRLTRSTDANGHVVSYAYDAANRLLSRTVDPNGLNLVTGYQYDAKGEQISATDPSGTVTAFSYDLKGEVLTQTVDPAGLALTTVYTYDQAGHTLSVTSPAGTLTQFSYDDLGRRTLAVVDPAGLALATSYQYDATGNMVASTDPSGNLSRYVYDADNRVSYAMDGAGNVTHYAYDANGRVTSTIHYATPISLDGLPPNASATDIAGRVVAVAALDAAQNNVYDADGRLTYTLDGTGAVASYTYDGAGNVVSRTHYANRIDLSSWTPGTTPAVAPSEYGAQGQDEVLRTVYDSLNRAIYTIDATGAVTAQTYDADGNVVDRIAYASPVYIGEPFTKATLDAAVAGLAQPDDARTRAVYDAANRLVWSVDGTGAVTHNDYDADGRLTSQTRFATAIAAGAAPDSVQASNADRRTDMLYDAAGRMVYQMRWTDRSNLASGVGDMRFVTSYAYDGDGRMTRETEHQLPLFSSVPNDLTDVYGNLTVAPEDRSTYMAYDAAGRMTYSVDAAGGITRNTYDGAGNVIASTRFANVAQTLPAGDHTVNGYTIPGLSAAQIAALVQPDALNDRTTLAAFDSAGRKVYAVDALGYVTQTRYDGVGRITASTQFANAATGLGIGATADAIANAVSPNAAADRTDSFAYDAAGNLIASTDALGHTESYVYNGLGEKTAFTNKLGATWNYAYDAAGRMTIEYAPDPSASEYQAYYGGLYADAQTVMTYDALGNMTSRTEGAETPNQRTTRYVYDAMGRQIGTIYPEVAVYNPAGDEVNDAYYGGAYGERSETWVTPTVQVVYDAFGDAVANVDVAGNISTKAYDKLGQVLYEVDALGYVTGYQRNDFGDVIALTRYASATSANAAVTPDGANAPTASQVENALAPSAADRTITTDYDLLGRAVRVTQPAAWVSNGSGQSYQASEVTTTAYDAFGDVVQTAALADLPANSWATTHYYYDRRGQQVASVDALGFLTTQSFDAAGNNTGVTQYANATSSASLTGYTAGATSTADRSVVYSYDQANRKTSQTQLNVSYSTAPDGSFVTGNLTTTYGYDALGNNTRTTDALGNNTYTYYDALGRIKAVASPSFTGSGGATITPLTEFDRDVYGNVVRKIQYANAAWANETQYAAGSDGTGPDDRVTTTQYDSHGNAIEVDDATGVAHYMSYDVQGHLAKAWQDVSGNDGIEQVLYSLFQYDALGRQTAVITPASTSVVSGGQIVTEAQSEAGSITTGMAWDAFGDMVQRGNYATGSAPQYQENFEYDSAGRLWRTNSGDGNVKVALYNLQGQQTSQIVSAGSQGSTTNMGVDLNAIANAQAADALGNSGVRRTDSQRDLLGRVLVQTLPSRMDSTDAASYRPVVYQSYDRWGNVILQSDVRNAAWVTQYTYNANNQVVLQKQPDGNGALSDQSPVTQIYYDALGRQIAIRDADGHVNGQAWNADGLLATEFHADGGVVNHSYDAFAEQVRVVDTMGGVTDYGYDKLGRNTLVAHENVGVYASNGNPLVGIVGGQQTLNIRTQYDQAGRKIVQGDGTDAGGMRYTYDLRGNVIAATDADGFVTLAAYDAQGKKTASQDANGSLATWSYDSFGQLTGHTDIGGAAYGFTYDNARQLIAQTSTNTGANSGGQNLAYAYDAAGQLTHIADGAINQQTYYAYNAAGQRVLEQTVQAGVTYQNQVLGYDTLGRLALVSGMDGVTLQTDYDKVGNKLHQHVTYSTLQPRTVIDYGNVQAKDESGNPIFQQVQTGTQTVQIGTQQVQTGSQTVQIGTQQVQTGTDEAGNPVYTTEPVYGQVPVYTTEPVYGQVPVYTSEPVYVQEAIGSHLVNDTIAHAQDLFFAYDSMNRQTLADGAVSSDASNLANLTLGQGHLLAYDKNGNRIQDRAWGTAVIPQYVQNYDESSGTALGAPVLTGYVSQQAIQTQWYSYDAMNRLTKVSTGAYGQVQTGQVQTGVDESTNAPIYSPTYTTEALGQDQAITLDTRFYDGASRVIQSGPAGSLPTAYLAALTQGNADLSGATTTTTRYDAAGRVVTQQVFNEADPTRSYTTYYQLFAPTTTPGPFDAPAAPGASGYDAAGNLLAYRLVRTSGSDFIVETHVLNQQKLDTYKEQSETVVDVNTSSGNVTSGATSMSYDANGFLTGVTDSAAPANSRTLYNDAQGHVLLKDQQGQLHQLVANGEVLGIYGQTLSAYQPPPPAPIPTDESSAPIYPVAAPAYTVTGNFDLAYQPVTNSYPAAATGSYPVQSGDTLKSIAQSAYGDSSLWYLIADANGLSGDSDLRVGQILNIPTKVGGVHNSSSTYAPYEPGRIVGATGPQLPTPAGRQDDDGGCGIGQIIVAVVAVVVAVFVPEIAPELFEAVGGAESAGGLALAAGIGDVAGQVVGNVIGVQDGFSFKEVALAALGAGLTAGVSGAIGDSISNAVAGATDSPLLGRVASKMATMAVSNAAKQAIAVTVGWQQDFSWTQVAASALSAGVTTGVQGLMNYNPANGFDLGKSLGSGFAGAVTSAAVKGGRINGSQIFSDAFGNVIGDSQAAANGQQTGSSSSSDDPLGALIALNGGWTGVSATPTFAEDHAARAAALNPGGLPTYSAATVEDGLNARNGSDVQDDLYVAQNGPGRASTRLNVQSGDTVEGLSKQIYGDDWRAGVAVLMSANNLRTNQWGSPIIRAGGTLLAPSLDGVSNDLLGALSTAGGNIESNNAAGLNQRAQLMSEATQRSAQTATTANAGMSNEQAGALYMAYGGRGASYAGSTPTWSGHYDETPAFDAMGNATGGVDRVWVSDGPEMSYGDQMAHVLQVGVGAAKGLVNGVPKMVASGLNLLWQSAAFQGATEIGMSDQEALTFAKQSTAGWSDGTVLSYANRDQALGGIGGELFSPIAYTKGFQVSGAVLSYALEGGFAGPTAGSMAAQRGSTTVEFLTGGLLRDEAAETATSTTQQTIGQKVYGPYYDEALSLHENNPQFFAHPDAPGTAITKGQDLENARNAYDTLVAQGELPPGHHVQGLAFGGQNISENITFTGETTIMASKLNGLDLGFYSENGYGTGTQKLWMYQETPNSPLVFGKNPAHTDATSFQNSVLAWQRRFGLR